MATKVEKRSERKRKNDEALGIDSKQIAKTTRRATKKEIKEQEEHRKNEVTKWIMFLITLSLLWFIFRFGGQS